MAQNDPTLKALVSRMKERGDDDDAIATVIRNYDAEQSPRHAFTAEEFTPPTGPQGSALYRFGSNLGQQLDPRNLGQAVRHPLDTLERIAGAANKNRLMAHEAFDKGDVVQGVARSVGGVPIVGPMLTGIGEQIGSGDYAGAAGTATGIGVLGAAAKVTPAVARAIPAAGGRVASGVAGTARTMVENPLATAAGAYEGYQAAGVPGAVAGAVGLPVGLRGVTKLLRPIVSKTDDADAKWAQEAKNLNARDAFLKRQAEQEAKAAQAASAPTKEPAVDPKWVQEAKNLDARDSFLKRQAAQEAKDLSVHQRMQERIQKATTREQVTAAKEQWNAILQEAKNLTAREKKLAEIAAEDAAQARFRELFPDGGERSAPAARITSSTKQDGVRTTTAQLVRPTGSAAADELVKSIKQRQTESVGIADAAAKFRELSRKTVLTPEEMQQFNFLKSRMQMSASESGLSYPASQSPRRYVGRDADGTMQLDPQKTLQQQALRKLFQKDQQ